MNIILGYGRTGKALAKFFETAGESFLIFDENPKSSHVIDFPQNSISEVPSDGFIVEHFVVSPGISTKYSRPNNKTNEFVKFAERNNIPLVSDIEFFMRKFPNKKYFAITGTNGKSTSTTLLNHILVESDLNSALCGNIGVSPFESAVDSAICSIEISNAQIELTHGVVFDISAITNFSPDHLDRYPTAEVYYSTKLEIAHLSKTLIINQNILNRMKVEHNNIIPFSIDEKTEGYYIHNSKIFLGEKELCPIPETTLIGRHNLENILCAFAVAHNFGVKTESITNAVKTFKGIAHRLEHIATKNGVKFFNDSKATNLDSTLNALRAFSSPIFLIAGGRLVEDISGIFEKEEFQDVKTIGIIGECSAIIAKELIQHNSQNPNKKIKYILCGDIQKAVETLYVEAQKIPNSAVVLSPFCKSFDQFKNFEERGEYFCTNVINLNRYVVIK